MKFDIYNNINVVVYFGWVSLKLLYRLEVCKKSWQILIFRKTQNVSHPGEIFSETNIDNFILPSPLNISYCGPAKCVSMKCIPHVPPNFKFHIR